MKRALGIDLGEARIGVAVSDELGMLAHALETIVVKDTRDPIARIVPTRPWTCQAAVPLGTGRR